MSSEVNGANLEEQPTAAPAGRKYCDTRKFYNLILVEGGGLTICRRRPPQIVGNYIGINQGGSLTAQEFSGTRWPVVGHTDWCGDHVDDPNALRGGGKTASLISTETSRAS